MDYVFIAIFGAIIGSFLGVVITRLHSKKSIICARSECLSCKKILHWFELIPIFSFIISRGSCRKCKNRIPKQDFWIEIATVALFVIAYKILQQQFGLDVSFTMLATSNHINYDFILILIRNLFVISSLVVIFLYDLNYYLILDRITIPSILIVFVLNLFITSPAVSIPNMLWGVLIAGGFFLLQFVISRGSWIGGGDIRLGILMGVLLGMPHTVTALVVSYVLGSVVGIGLIISKKKKMQSQVPFGTFLSIGTIIALFWSEKIIGWYSNLFI